MSDQKWEFDSGIYRALMAEWIHQDRLMWGRTQLLIAIQGAAVSTGYLLRGYWAGPIILVVGGLLTALLFRLAYRDREDRDEAKSQMVDLADVLSKDHPARKMADTLPQDRDRSRRGVERITYYVWTGDGMLATVCVAFMILDVLLIAYFATRSEFPLEGGLFPSASAPSA